MFSKAIYKWSNSTSRGSCSYILLARLTRIFHAFLLPWMVIEKFIVVVICILRGPQCCLFANLPQKYESSAVLHFHSKPNSLILPATSRNQCVLYNAQYLLLELTMATPSFFPEWSEFHLDYLYVKFVTSCIRIYLCSARPPL